MDSVLPLLARHADCYKERAATCRSPAPFILPVLCSAALIHSVLFDSVPIEAATAIATTSIWSIFSYHSQRHTHVYENARLPLQTGHEQPGTMATWHSSVCPSVSSAWYDGGVKFRGEGHRCHGCATPDNDDWTYDYQHGRRTTTPGTDTGGIQNTSEQ